MGNAKISTHVQTYATISKKLNRWSAPKVEGKVKVLVEKNVEGEEIVAEEGSYAFCIQLQTLEFMAKQERRHVKRFEKKEVQRAGFV